MVRKVVDSAMVAHLWANQLQDEARNGKGSLSFVGNTLYSYRTPIGQIGYVNGHRVFLETCDKYSKTTEGKHKNAMRRAVDIDEPRYFVVPWLNLDYPTAIQDNLDYLVERYTDRVKQLKRKITPWQSRVELVEEDLQEVAYKARLWADLARLPFPDICAERDAQEIWATWEARKARENDPAVIAKREKDRARRAANVVRKNEKILDEWRSGKRYSLPWDLQRSLGHALLRVSDDELLTSQGARVPLQDAIKVFRAVQACREAKRSWRRNGETLPVGQFQVDLIEPTGDFRAGCHRIKWEECERVAKQLNLI